MWIPQDWINSWVGRSERRCARRSGDLGEVERVRWNAAGWVAQDRIESA